jgi:quercetin dioxygenase-like cupin family protein
MSNDDRTGVGRRLPADKMSIYRREDALDLDQTDMMVFATPSKRVAEILANLDLSKFVTGTQTKVLLRHEGDSGFSLVYASFPPDYILGRHTHNTDCTYYVLSGELRLGNQTLSAGEGFFAPANRPYGYTAGPVGVEVLEFRHATAFDIKAVEVKEEVLAKIAEVANTHQDVWRTHQPPREREKVSD